MQGIGQQQQRIYQLRSFRGEDTRLATPIRMTTQPDTLRLLFADLEDLFAEALAVACRVTGPRGTMRPLLTKRKIITERLDVGFVKSFRYRYQKWGVAVRSRAVC
jgi:hypothetical protein